MESSIIPYLFLVTFIFAMALGIWQYVKVRKARAEHHRSASARANHEPRTTDGPRPR